MSHVRTTAGVVPLQHHRMSAGFSSFGLRSRPGLSLDPFLNIDDFTMSVPTFPPHPHAGFSAVTYLFEDSKGSFTNRDSLGDSSVIGPGALHWTQAARGMMHEEIPRIPGIDCHGLQMFVNLRAADRGAEPRAFHVDAASIPEVVNQAGARVRVLAGTFAGRSSPLTDLLTPVVMFDVHLSPGAMLAMPFDRAHRCFVLAISGDGVLGDATPLQAHEAAILNQDGGSIHLRANASGLQVLVAGGMPLNEPVVFGGPFVMSNQQELSAAFARYERGEMGRLSPSA